MDLKIKDVAELLNVSATTIRRWLNEGKIPAYRLNHQYRFNRTEIENWVLNHKMNYDEDKPASPYTGSKTSLKKGPRQYSLYRALHKGKVIHHPPGTTKEEIILSTSESIAKQQDLEPEILNQYLLERERLMSTSIGNGIAVPHTRDFLLDEHFDLLTVVFPEKPIPYDALDGQPVHVLFFLFASNDKHHLHLLAKIAHFCSQGSVQKLLKNQPSKNELLNAIKAWESTLTLAEEDAD